MASVSPDPLSVRAAARSHSGAPALIIENRTWTYAELWQDVEPLYDRLRTSLQPSQHLIALTATNRFETARILYALLEARIPAVLLHPRLSLNEHIYCLNDSHPDVVLWDKQLGTAPPYSAVGTRDFRLPRGTAFVLYTSGTTGRPKGAIVTRHNLITSAHASEANLGFERSDRWGCCMPICHIGGLSILTRCLIGRKPIVLMERFRPKHVVDTIQKHGVTLLSVVPTMLTLLLREGDVEALQSLRAVLVGGAPTPANLLEECVRLSIRALPTYGMTEACSQVATWSPSDPLQFTGVGASCGRPLPGVELRLVGKGDEREIQVRGPMVFAGYLRESRRKAHQWFSTGDIGCWDAEKRLIVLARRTDLILVGGENVYPAEVEQILSGCPGIGAVMVYGVADPVVGQVVAADVVPDAGFDAAVLSRFAEQNLAAYKRPKAVRLVAELAMGTTGKLRRPGCLTAQTR